MKEAPNIVDRIRIKYLVIFLIFKNGLNVKNDFRNLMLGKNVNV
jgi:hypothetical protein